jgi:peptidyl-dipeptidase A
MEMDEERLFATLSETDAVTAEPFARWKHRVDGELARRFRCDVADLKPWHYDDPFFQEVPAAGGIDLDDVFTGLDVVRLAADTFGQLGLDAEEILRASDLSPRPGKCQHAFCLDVDRMGDVRVLANVRDNYYWAETMLHELGHGVHGLRYGDGLPWLLRDAHLTVTEGIAILMGRLASDPAWLASVAGLGREAEALSAELRSRLATELLVFTRWVLVMTNFERSFYANPDQDLGELWWRLVRRYQLLTPPGDLRPDDWAAKIHIACAPVYYHTYLYGNVIASQIAATLRREPGGLVGRPEAGRFLEAAVFRPGESLRWDDLVAAATGEPLTVRHYAADIAAGY